MEFLGDIFKSSREAIRRADLLSEVSIIRSNKSAIIREYGQSAYDECLRNVKSGVKATDALAYYKQQKEPTNVQVTKAPPIMGSAKWATRDELNRAGLLHPFSECMTTPALNFGSYFGEHPEDRKTPEDMLLWNGDSHLLTVAPTGAGKSAVQIIPNLLSYKGSVFVYDPKGELYEATSFYRSQIGSVYRLAPFEEDTDAFNPLDMVKDFDDAMELATMVYPSEADNNGAFFEDDARNFIAAIIYLHSFQGDNNMGAVSRFARQSGDKIRSLAKEIAEIEDMPQVIRDSMESISQYKNEAITTVKRSMDQKLMVWVSEKVQKATEYSDFDFSELKTGTTTVYVTVPFHKLETYKYFVKTVMSYALDSMVSTRTRPKIPVLFLIDEFLALGNFPKFANALNTHRGAGVRLWYILQDTPSLEDIYGIKWKSFFAAAEVKCYMGTRDHFTAEMISNMLGNKTLAYTTTSTSGNVSISGKDASFFEAGTKSTSMSYGRSTSTQVTSRPLLNPQEIQDILGHVTPDQARFGLIDLAGASPVQTILRPWYTSTFYQARFGCRTNKAGESILLWLLWKKFNEDFFNNKLIPPTELEYVDLSMGRDGFCPFNIDYVAYNDFEHRRVLFLQAYKRLEHLYAKYQDDPTPEGQRIKHACLNFLGQRLINRMIAYGAYQIFQQNSENAHENLAFDVAKAVHHNAEQIPEGVRFTKPTPENIGIWPINSGAEILEEIIRTGEWDATPML